MAVIDHVYCVPAKGAYFQEDLTALQENPCPLEDRYFRAGTTPGFEKIRMVGETLSLGLKIDGRVFWGDAVGVAYGGKAGREARFHPSALASQVEERLRNEMVGSSLLTFREMSRKSEAFFDTSRAALTYGLSQAVLQAVAFENKCTMTEILCREWDLSIVLKPVGIHAQSGTDKYDGADKMLAHRIASLPHALVDSPVEQLGERGEKLIQYVKWLSKRMTQFDHRATLHLDVHGGIGLLFENDPTEILSLLLELERLAKPHPIRIESVAVCSTQSQQLLMMKELRASLEKKGSQLKLVVDEWANTLEDITLFAKEKAAHMIQIKMPDLGGVDKSVSAVLACKEHGVESLLGGSCNETEINAKIAAHVALATQPTAVLAKPGMGVTEGIMLVHNEMQRTLAVLT